MDLSKLMDVYTKKGDFAAYKLYLLKPDLTFFTVQC